MRRMKRLAACIALFVLAGSTQAFDAPATGEPSDRSQQATDDAKQVVGTPPDSKTESTLIEVVGEKSISFDPKSCLRGGAGFGWGLGSEGVNVLGRKDGQCIFDYHTECEGGYAVYRVSVPVDGGPVKVELKNGSIVTSFSLDDAKLLRSRNILLDLGKPRPGALNWRQQSVPDTDYVNYVADVLAGKGEAADDGDRVTVRYTLYADDAFDFTLPDVEKNRAVEFTIGTGEVGPGLEAAANGMTVGSKRRVRMREEVADRIVKDLGGIQPNTMLAIEIELTKIE